MYKKVVEDLIAESKKVNRVRLDPVKVNQVMKSVNKLSAPIPIQENNVNTSEKKNKIPITTPPKSRFPTKLVNFEDNVHWL